MSLGQVLRGMFFQLDAIIYGLVSKIYYLFYLLTETTFFSSDTIETFTSRIYILISIIMAFRLAFSFINYIISPDTITDKQKGGGKLIKNIVISIALLAAVPMIFSEAYYLQGIIIKNNTIPRLILGNHTSIGDLGKNDERSKTATELATYTFFAFIGPNQRISACKNSAGLVIESDCVDFLNDKSTSKGKKLGDDYKGAIERRDFTYIINSASRNDEYSETSGANEGYSDKKVFLLDYQWGISTIAGLYLCFVLLGFCLDVSIRIIKLGFLQLIAPIPIVMNLSPDKKSGDMLSKWGKECFSTWASLFIRIAVISFAIFFIGEINKSGGIFSYIRGGEPINNLFVSVFVVFGILLFAKEFPKLLEDILGIKGSGKLTLNPLKKLKTDMVGAGIIGGATAGLLGGGLGGAIRGIWAGRNAKDFSEGAKKAADSNRRRWENEPSSFRYRQIARYNKLTGAGLGEGTIVQQERELDEKIKRIENNPKYVDNNRRIAERKAFTDSVDAMEKRAISKIENGEAGVLSIEYRKREAHIKALEAQLDEAARTGASPTVIDGLTSSIATEQNAMRNYLNDEAMKKYIDANTAVLDGNSSWSSGGISSSDIFGTNTDGTSKSDAALSGMTQQMRNIVSQYQSTLTLNRTALASASDLHSAYGKQKGEITTTKTENEEFERQKREFESRKKELYSKKSKYDAANKAVK